MKAVETSCPFKSLCGGKWGTGLSVGMRYLTETGLSQLKFVTEKEKVIGRRHPCQDQQTVQRDRESGNKIKFIQK